MSDLFGQSTENLSVSAKPHSKTNFNDRDVGDLGDDWDVDEVGISLVVCAGD